MPATPSAALPGTHSHMPLFGDDTNLTRPARATASKRSVSLGCGLRRFGPWQRLMRKGRMTAQSPLLDGTAAARGHLIRTLCPAPAIEVGPRRAALLRRYARAPRLPLRHRGATARAAGTTRLLRRCLCLRCALAPRRWSGLPPRRAGCLRQTGPSRGSASRATCSRSAAPTRRRRLPGALRLGRAARPPRHASARRWRRAWLRRRAA